jgi:hypothetical protein
MPRLSPELGLAVAAIIITIVLVVLDKAEKLRGGVLLALLVVAALMTLPLALGNPLVAGASSQWKWWLRMLALAVVGFSYWAVAIWITSPEKKLASQSAEQSTTPATVAKSSRSSSVLPAVQVPPLRRPMDAQTKMLRSWIRQTMDRTGAREMWLSQIFQSVLDGTPGGPDIDVPQALRHLASEGEVEILETTVRTYRTWWGELFNEDIRFRVKTLSQ